MIIQNWKKDVFTIPNGLSLFRLLMIPVYMTIYIHAKTPRDYIIAAGVLSISCLTDAIDGKIARKYHMVSTVGKILDPLADKVTQFTLIICLAIRHSVLWVLVCLFLLKEGFQLLAGIIEFKKGNMLTGALITGKICTTILFISLILLMLLPKITPVWIGIITIIDSICMTVSFTHYTLTYCKHTPMIQRLEEKDG